MDYNTIGQLVRIQNPSGYRRIYFKYETGGLLSSIYYDNTELQFHYYASTKKLYKASSVSTLVGQNYSCALLFGYGDALVTSHGIVFNDTNSRLVYAEFRYAYDDYFRYATVDGTVAGKTLRTVTYNYSADTGRVETVSPFVFEYPRLHREVTRDANVEIVREFDRYGRAVDVWFSFNNYIVFTVEIKYNSLGRIYQWRRKVGSSDIKAYEYLYDIDGNAIEVLVNGHSTWKYEIDANSNIVRVGYYDQVREIIVNDRDQVVANGAKVYVYNADGFVVRRDGETFEYDAFGHMTRAVQVGGHDVRYVYDAKNRLTIIHETSKDVIVQLFYSDQFREDRVTHSYDHSSGKTSEYFYDPRGKLFGLRQEDDYYYIGLDSHDSLVLVLNALGSVVKQINYDPLGAQTTDTGPEIPLLFGFQCGIIDTFTNLVFFAERTYDPSVGRWMGPSYRSLIDNVQEFPANPDVANLYLNPSIHTKHPLNTNSFSGI